MSSETQNQREPDGYDDAVAYLTEHPDEIAAAWDDPFKHKAGCLFVPVAIAPSHLGVMPRRRDGKMCGCLTQVRAGHSFYGTTVVAWTDALTAAIQADDRLPRTGKGEGIEPLHLPHLAEWQRRIDAELGRTPPARRS